jgi:hypothetical protein
MSSNDGFVQAYDAHGIRACSATTRACAALWDEDVNINLGPVEVGDGRVFVSAGDGSVRVFALPS